MLDHQNAAIVSYEVWAAALASSASIGLASLVPWLFNMTFFEKHRSALDPSKDARMNFILCFAVGAMLGDLFFHLIPESYQSHLVYNSYDDGPTTTPMAAKEDAHKTVGLSIIAGIFMFIIVEQVLERWSTNLDAADLVATATNKDKLKAVADKGLANTIVGNRPDLNHNYESSHLLSGKPDDQFENNNNNNNNNDHNIMDMNSCQVYSKKVCPKKDGVSARRVANKSVLTDSKVPLIEEQPNKPSNVDKVLGSCTIVDPAGYLNLIANSFDNFTHGLAIGASFLVGAKVGLLTTFVIFIHEVPHEICDYAILVNSGFSRLDAVKAQSSVSLFSLLGTAIALYVRSVETLTAQTLWILPFSAGGFLYIALVNLLPEILDSAKADIQDTLMQIACVFLGISFMAAVAVF